nr:odorant binding protein [Semanotus bifasciatus]
MYSSTYCLLTFLLVGTSVVQAILQESEYGDKLGDLSKMLHGSCAALTGIDEALIDRVKNGDIPDDPTLKKYAKCLLVSSTAMGDDGTLNKEFIMDIMPAKLRSEVSKTFDVCAPIVGAASGLENKAHTFLTCVRDENPDVFVFF